MHACPHAALLPLQVSDVHGSPSSVQVVPPTWKTSLHELLVPVQWSAPSLSHAPPCEAPVQLVDADAKPFGGHGAPTVPLQVSATSQTPAVGRQVVPAGWTTSAGQAALLPVQRSSGSQTTPEPFGSPEPVRHTTVLDLKPSAGHAAPGVPLQVSATSQTPAVGRQVVPAGSTTSAGQAALLPVQRSSGSQTTPEPFGSPEPVRHTTVLDLKPSAGHAAPAVPLQVSATSQTPAVARQVVPAGSTTSAGQAALLPVQRSSGSQTTPEPFGSPEPVRHTTVLDLKPSAGHAAPAAPLQVSAPPQAAAVGRQVVPAGWTTSAGQAALLPVQRSSGSQTTPEPFGSPEPVRHTTVLDLKPSAGHAAPGVPLQVSATSQTPAVARQVVPAGSTTSAGQAALLPVQRSSGSQTTPEPFGSPEPVRHTTVLDLKPSAGHAAPAVPLQVSATSQTPAVARQVVPAGSTTSAGQAALLPVQRSSGSQTTPEPFGSPEPVRHTTVLNLKPSAGHAAPAVPLQVSATSQTPGVARQGVPAGGSTPAGQAALLPVQCSAGSQTTPEPFGSPEPVRHTTVLDLKPSAGHAAPAVPLQVSATSQTPAVARQVVPAGSTTSAGQAALLPVQRSSGSRTTP